MKELIDYVLQHTIRGACTCGRCIDSVPNPEDHQPKERHMIDMTFFKVAKTDGANKEQFLALVEKHIPKVMDGREYSYMELGPDLGNQEVAIRFIALGSLLDAWAALVPEEVLPFLEKELKLLMAGQGMLALQAERKE